MPSKEGAMSREDKIVAKQALAQKRNVRDLNTRLEMYVRSVNETRKQNDKLKKAMATRDLEHQTKLNQQRAQLNESIDKLRSELEATSADYKCALQELADSNRFKQEYEERLVSAESRNASLVSENEQFTKEKERYKSELDEIRQQYASLKYKHESFETDRKATEKRNKETMKQNERLLREVTKMEADRKAEKDAQTLVLVEKNDEISNLRETLNKMEANTQSTQNRMRQEFDTKLADFIKKREDQYNLEKEEWMRIFKDEFNRKLASFKEANHELGDQNVRQNAEIAELRTRISKLKQQKTELEVVKKHNEEEIERRTDDLDLLRRAKDAEIHDMKCRLDQECDRFKAKEIQFDELAGIKMQLDAEIELYRDILNEAEEACDGRRSPLDAKYTSTGKRNRKRRRISRNTMTPMGPLNKNRKIVTPGLTRAAKNAESDLIGSFESVTMDEEMKDAESESLDSIAMANETPGNFEGSTLQFSGLDLNRGMIEIQNVGETPVGLSGYTLANKTGTAQFTLPKTKVLETKERLRVYVGADYEETEKNPEQANDLVGDFPGGVAFWARDVWAADEPDIARLYNPQSEEVARIEISPEMVDKASAKKGCLIM